MHQPPIPQIDAEDPEIAGLIHDEARRQHDKFRMIPSENYVSLAVLEAVGHGADEQVLRGLPGPAVLRGPAAHRPDRDDRDRARAGAVRRGARERAAVLGLARQPGRLPGVRQARRHRHGPVAADGRPPDPRRGPRRSAASGSRPVQYGVRRDTGRIDLDEVRDLALRERPKIIFCGGTALPRTVDFPGLRRDRRGGRRGPGGGHRAHRRPDRGRRAPVPGRPRPGDHHDHAQDAARPARRDDHDRRRARVGDRQGRLPRPAGRPAQPHHRRHRGRAARGGAAVVPRLRRPGGQERHRPRSRAPGARLRPGVRRHRQPPAARRPHLQGHRAASPPPRHSTGPAWS